VTVIVRRSDLAKILGPLQSAPPVCHQPVIRSDGYDPGPAVTNTIELAKKQKVFVIVRVCGHAHRDPGAASA
jgi:hypothetical protein